MSHDDVHLPTMTVSVDILLWSLADHHHQNNCLKSKSMQRSGTEAIKTQIQLSKQKQEINNITNSQNTNRTSGQPSEQLFHKRWPLSNRNRTITR